MLSKMSELKEIKELIIDALLGFFPTLLLKKKNSELYMTIFAYLMRNINIESVYI